MFDRKAFHQWHFRHLLRQVKGPGEFQPVPHVTAPRPAVEKAVRRVTVGERMRRWLAVIAKEKTALRQVAGSLDTIPSKEDS